MEDAAARRLPAARRRRQLLDVSLDLFAAKGFHATSMVEIAAAAGVTKPVLYQHFRSKRLLYLELLDDVGSQLIEALATAAAEPGPRAQIEGAIEAYVRLMATKPQAYPLLFGSGALRGPEFADAVRRVERSMADAVATLIHADVDPVHRKVLAAAIVGMTESVLRHWGAGDLDASPEALFRQVADLAWNGLRGIPAV